MLCELLELASTAFGVCGSMEILQIPHKPGAFVMKHHNWIHDIDAHVCLCTRHVNCGAVLASKLAPL